METWQEREIPLHIILRSIEKVFDNHEKSKKKRTIKSLTFCSEEIEAQFEEWLESQVGKAESAENEAVDDSIFADDTIKNHLESVINSLKEVEAKDDLQETITRVLHRLNELKTSYKDAESLESSLTDLEKLIDEALIKNVDNTLHAEISQQMSAYKKQMDAETYQRTFNLMLLKKMKESQQIPRLSLFYL